MFSPGGAGATPVGGRLSRAGPITLPRALPMVAPPSRAQTPDRGARSAPIAPNPHRITSSVAPWAVTMLQAATMSSSSSTPMPIWVPSRLGRGLPYTTGDLPRSPYQQAAIGVLPKPEGCCPTPPQP